MLKFTVILSSLYPLAVVNKMRAIDIAETFADAEFRQSMNCQDREQRNPGRRYNL